MAGNQELYTRAQVWIRGGTLAYVGGVSSISDTAFACDSNMFDRNGKNMWLVSFSLEHTTERLKVFLCRQFCAVTQQVPFDSACFRCQFIFAVNVSTLAIITWCDCIFVRAFCENWSEPESRADKKWGANMFLWSCLNVKFEVAAQHSFPWSFREWKNSRSTLETGS